MFYSIYHPCANRIINNNCRFIPSNTPKNNPNLVITVQTELTSNIDSRNIIYLKACLHVPSPSPSPSKFIIVLTVTDHLTNNQTIRSIVFLLTLTETDTEMDTKAISVNRP